MDIKITLKDNYAIFQVKGSLDMYTSVELKSRTDDLKLKQGFAVVLQLNDVNYIDSSGIGTLIKIVNAVQEAQGEVFLTGIRPMIEKIFRVAGLMSYFSFLTEEEFKNRFPV